MPILFIAFAFTLLASPLYTQSLFRDAYVWEKAQIDLDNAAIVLGRNDRWLLRDMERKADRFRRADKLHDAVHFCARLVSPQTASCQTADKLWERWFSIQLKQAMISLRARWQLAGEDAARRLGQAGHRLAVFRRSELALRLGPRCPRCGLEVSFGLARSSLPLRTELRLHSSPALPIEAGVEMEESETFNQWDYRLLALLPRSGLDRMGMSHQEYQNEDQIPKVEH